MELDPLPPTKDEYWEHAQTFKEEVFETKDCGHYFVHKSSSEVECRACRVGFILSPGWSVTDGSLKTPDGFVVRLLGSSLVTG